LSQGDEEMLEEPAKRDIEAKLNEIEQLVIIKQHNQAMALCK